jgi:hypothetical protein
MLWLLLACWGGRATQALPDGVWSLEGEDITGLLQIIDDRCWIGLWGTGFRTGETAVDCQSFSEAGRIELLFSLEIGAGAASASAWTTPEMERLILPLGSRPGEHELSLTMRPQMPSSPRLNAAMKNSAVTLSASEVLWNHSVFRLEESGELVGEVFLPSDGPPELQLYSSRWMTRGRVKAALVEKGPDLWLSFDIMPALKAESGLLILNRATNKGVLPLSESPVPGEQSFELVDGAVSVQEREAAIASGMAAAVLLERAVMERLAQESFDRAVAMNCPPWAQIEDHESSLAFGFEGYAVSTQKEGENCVLSLEPRPIQLGRRLAIRVRPEGVESVARPLSF